MRFKDKVVLVTGSSRGIGKKLIQGFAEEGANVVINYYRSKKQAEELEVNINGKFNRCISIQTDVGDINQVESMFKKIISEFRKIDILVNNAAINIDSAVWKMSIDDWEMVIRNDLTSVFNCTKFALADMRKHVYGRIINISSVVGQIGSFGTCNYAAAKSGIFGFTKGVAKEVAKKNITVNSIALGFIEIGMQQKLPQEVKNSVLKQIPLGRWGKPKEVVDTVKFVASEEAGYITGQVLHLNGGYYM